MDSGSKKRMTHAYQQNGRRKKCQRSETKTNVKTSKRSSAKNMGLKLEFFSLWFMNLQRHTNSEQQSRPSLNKTAFRYHTIIKQARNSLTTCKFYKVLIQSESKPFKIAKHSIGDGVQSSK